MHLNREKLKYDLKGKTCRKWENRQNIYIYEKQNVPRGCLPLPRSYIHVHDHHIQTSSAPKPLGQSKPNFMWSIVRRGNENLYKLSRSHDQDGRHGYKYQKPLNIFYSRTRRPMILKIGMKHQAIEPYKVCINHDPGMTLTYFTARST